MEDVERVVKVGEVGRATVGTLELAPINQAGTVARTTAASAGKRANSSAQVTPSRA
jgi:hypothetical protein